MTDGAGEVTPEPAPAATPSPPAATPSPPATPEPSPPATPEPPAATPEPSPPAASPATEPAPAAAPARPRWEPPETASDRFSRLSRKAIRAAVTAFGLLVLVVFILWLIPKVVVARSPQYQAAAAATEADPMLLNFATGTPRAARWPESYQALPDGTWVFGFEVDMGPGSLPYWREVEVDPSGAVHLQVRAETFQRVRALRSR